MKGSSLLFQIPKQTVLATKINNELHSGSPICWDFERTGIHLDFELHAGIPFWFLWLTQHSAICSKPRLSLIGCLRAYTLVTAQQGNYFAPAAASQHNTMVHAERSDDAEMVCVQGGA